MSWLQFGLARPGVKINALAVIPVVFNGAGKLGQEGEHYKQCASQLLPRNSPLPYRHYMLRQS